MSWERFNDQFRETDWERNDRLRRAFHKRVAACPHVMEPLSDEGWTGCSKCGYRSRVTTATEAKEPPHP